MDSPNPQYEALVKRVEKLAKFNAELRKLVAVQADEIAFLKKENRRILNELRKFSNENTPRGSIPPYLKPALRNKVEQAMKGEEKEKKPNPRNSRPQEHDAERDITLARCPCCGGTRITRKAKSYLRTTMHIQFPSLERILNKIWAYYCLDCKKEVTPAVPDALPNSKFDLSTAILISVFFTAFNMSDRKISELFSMIFSLNISPSSVSNTLAALKDYLKDDYKKLEKEIGKAPFVHRDDTSWRKNGKPYWLGVASTANAVYFKINKHLNSKNAKKLKLAKDCVQISDAHSVYNNTCKEQQKCWAHLSRLAKKPKHYFRTQKEKRDYEKQVSGLMELFSRAKKDKLALGYSNELKEKYESELLELLGEKNRRTNRWFGKNALRLKHYALKQKGKWFTFLKYKDVKPTNNKAEQDIRHPVLKRNISQQSRSTNHMHSYEMQLSLYMTSKQLGEEYPKTLHDIITPQITGKY
ncbi:MAG TPA: transposase [archaeon]|nr:transposase [archaeon]